MARRKHQELKGKVTMQQVARQANTSLSSVSRVLHDYPGIHPELRQRILQSMQELGYAPPSGKQRLIKFGKRLIHFLLTNREIHINPHSRIFQAIERETTRHGDLLVYKSFRFDPATPARQLPLAELLELDGRAPGAGPAAGVILTGLTHFDLLKELERLDIPYVLLGNNYVGPEPPKTDAIYFDGYRGACESTRYLIDLGHTHILFIGDPNIGWFSSLYQGYLDAIKQAGLTPITQTKTLSDSFYSNGYSSVQIAFEQTGTITAIFSGCDEIALGAWKALNDRSLEVPKDVSLMGFDDEDYASFTVPPLSTVRIDVDAIGRELIHLLYAKLENPTRKLPAVHLPSNLIKRGTCRPVLVETRPFL
ncbi:MAG: LacI family transcriptional regulator [Acidobacteria bacterium]|nr:LacI family transcriptional regulator [Acidobacteriota bacterium]MCI0722786.1 LacI family transcriptional regulator [Acidobacteriota bacterium]